MKTITAQTLSGAHEQVIRYILHNGTKRVVNGVVTLESDATSMVIVNPLSEPRFVNWLPFDRGFMDEYAKQILVGNHDGKSQFEYDYHDRLYHWRLDDSCKDIDQIKYIVDSLTKSETTRRAIATTWIPPRDEHIEDVPCLQIIQCSLRGVVLEMTVVFRSNDMLLAAGPNMYGLTELQRDIARRISDKTGLDVICGKYTHISLIPHIYIERDLNYVQWLL